MRKGLLKSVTEHLKNTIKDVFTSNYVKLILAWIVFVMMVPYLHQVAGLILGLGLLAATMIELSNVAFDEEDDDDTNLDGRA